MAFRMKFRNPTLIKFVSLMGAFFLRILYGTCRKVILCPDHHSPYKNESETRYLYCVWHDHLLMPIFSARTLRMAGLVSRHADGSLLAAALSAVRIKAVRGSTSRGATQATKQMLDALKHHDLTITPDGPRGPRREAKPGLIFLASRANRNIIPCSFRCKRYWRIQGSWTDMLIPKPFTTIYLMTGDPISVPEDLPREEMEHYQEILQRQMNDLERQLHDEEMLTKLVQDFEAGTYQTMPSHLETASEAVDIPDSSLKDEPDRNPLTSKIAS